ncbi:hypothetical protein [Dokdonella sp.]|uniref:hypothetical protein n=1 Tax=Dokdonella sp. TaxID=2291710 RepID=UPI003C662F41
MIAPTRHRVLRSLAVLLLGLLVATAAIAKPSNKWRIKCNHRADVAGVIVLRLTPEGQAAVEVTVDIAKGTRENEAARTIRKAIKSSALGERYKIEIDDGEDVLIKRRSRQPNIDLEIVSNTADGLKIKTHRE